MSRILSHVALSLLLLGTTSAFGLQKADSLPDWPVTPKVPDVMPPRPVPVLPVSALGMDQLYVVQSDDDVQLLDSPPGVVSVVRLNGPIRLRGKFVDGSGIVETRQYTKKHVFEVSRVGPGNVELLMVPAGKVERRTVDDPIPPPPTPVPPGPNPPEPPKPDVPVKVTSFRVIIVFESADTLTIEQKAAIYAKPVSDYLTAKCTPEGGYAGWRRYDPQMVTTDEQPMMKAFWNKVKDRAGPLPRVEVEVNGDKTYSIPITFEADGAKRTLKPAEVIEAVKKYRGE